MKNKFVKLFSFPLVVLIAISLVFLIIPIKSLNFKENSAGSISKISNDEKISAVIVPHFDVFASQRQALLQDIGQTPKPKTIMLVSVNHFNTGNENILTTDRNWTTDRGTVEADNDLIAQLTKSKIAGNDENAFTNEHGIKNILDDIKSSFPESKILPIIIKDSTSQQEMEQLAQWLIANTSKTLLISSVDFSHYCPPAIARIHDSFSIQALSSMDTSTIWRAETDSPQTLYLTNIIAKSAQDNFHLYYNNNVSDITNSDTETTSVVMGYYSDKPTTDNIKPATSFVIAGDMMFDRDVWNLYSQKGLATIFNNFGNRPFRGTNLSLANLEGPISSIHITGIRDESLMTFNFSPLVPSVLKYININAVSLANNHSNNAGNAGFLNTQKILSDSEIDSFGLPSGLSDDSIRHINGPVPLSIIGIDALSSFDETALETMIITEKNTGGFVLIFPHWGSEYETTHNAIQENLAKKWITAGADMIVGSHPHVIQDFQIIDGKPVVYSLGNFVFDQFFSSETQRGLILAGTVDYDKVTLSFLPIQEEKAQPEFLTGADKDAIINRLINFDSINVKKITSDTIEIAR